MQDEWIDYLSERTRERDGHADSWCTLGQALAAVGRHSEALAALDRSLAINPRYVAAAISRCFVLGESGQTARGYVAFRELSAASFHCFDAVFGLGVYCMRHGWTDTGVAQLRRAQRIRPRAAFVGSFYAAALDQVGDSSAARVERTAAQKLWEQLLEDVHAPASVDTPIDFDFACTWPEPGRARLHVQRAAYASMHDRSDLASEELRQANARFPGDAGLLVETGRLCVARDLPAEAEAWLELAIAVDEACGAAHLELGFLLTGPDRIDEALDHLQTAVELGPLYPDYRYHLGTLLLDVGRAAAAVEHLEQALILEPTHGHAALQLATAFYELGEHAEALRILESAACSEWPEARVFAAEIVAAERPEEAREILDGVLADDPGHPDARRVLERLS